MKQFTIKISLFSLFLIILLSACGGGDSNKKANNNGEKYTLEYKLAKGDTFKQNVATDMNMSQEAMGQQIEIGIKMNMGMHYDVIDVQDSSIALEMKFDEMKMSMTSPMGAIEYDSNTTEEYATLQDMGPMFKAIIGIPVEIIVDKTGDVKSAKGFEKLADAMIVSLSNNFDASTKEQMVTQFGEQFSEESIKSMLNASGNLPDKPVAIGDKWNINMSTKNGNIEMIVNMEMVLKSVENNVATIEGEGSLGTDEPVIQDANGMEVKITMKGTQKSIVKIDMNTGQTISAVVDQNVTGESEVMGMKVPMKMKIKTTITN